VRIALACLAILVLGGPGLADDPVLGIYTEGGHFCYPLAEISRIEFANDTLVVETTGGTDSYPLAIIQRIDFSSILTAVQSPETAAALPKILKLFPNQPNPFSPETRIAFLLPEVGAVQLKIYGVNGRLVRTLVEGEQPAGSHRVAWNGRDDSGREVPAGVYFSQLTVAGVTESRKMVLLR
jgi:hypothetical protein